MSTNIHLNHCAGYQLFSCPLYSVVFFPLLTRRKLHGKPTRMHFTENVGKYQFGIHFPQSMAHPALKAAFTLSGIRSNTRPASVSYNCKINISKLQMRRDLETLSGKYFQMVNNKREIKLSGQCSSRKRGNICSLNSLLIVDILQLISIRGKKKL